MTTPITPQSLAGILMREAQAMDKMTTLPKRTLLRRVMPDDWRYGDVYGYTAAQMMAYAAEQAAIALVAEREKFDKVLEADRSIRKKMATEQAAAKRSAMEYTGPSRPVPTLEEWNALEAKIAALRALLLD